MHGIHQLAVDVELQLVRRRVADAHGPRAFVTGKPRHLPLGETPLAGDAIHDLHLVGCARERAQKPIAPGFRLLVVAGVHQGLQREGRVAQPAVAVVPVARAGELLRERGRRRRDDAAGGAIGQRFQGDQRAGDRFAVLLDGRCLLAPVAPELLGGAERLQRIDGRRRADPGGRVAENERYGLAGGDDELRDRLHVLAASFDRRAQDGAVGPGNRAHRFFVEANHPGHDRPVIEAQDELGAHRDLAAFAHDQAHDVGRLAARRHEVDHGDDAILRFVRRLEDEGILAVGTRRLGVPVDGPEQPAAVLGRAEQRGKASPAVESGPTEPVDRPVLGDERRRLAVADQGIIFDLGRRGASSPLNVLQRRALARRKPLSYKPNSLKRVNCMRHTSQRPPAP